LGRGNDYYSIHIKSAPMESLDRITPYEAWSIRKPRVDHFRVFGSLVHVKVVNSQQSKLEDKSALMVLFGYEKGSKAYRIYNPNTKRVHVTRDVVFEEDKKWDWKIEEDEHNFQTSTGFSVDQSELETKYQCGENEVRQQGSESPTVVPEFAESGVQDKFEDFEEESQGTPVRLRSLEEIYNETQPVQVNYTDTCLIGVEEPTNFADAVRDKNWKGAMVDEIKAIQENKTWSLVESIHGQKVIGLKWVFKLKKDAEGKLVKYKASLVAKGYVQQQGIDFEEVFAHVARMETVRLIAVIAVQQGWLLHHMDVKSAFLNEKLKEEVYVSQPPDFKESGKEYQVLKLHKALYGLKQALRAWNSKLDNTLKLMNFERRQLEHAVYRRKKGEEIILVGVYVDDLLITGTSETEIAKFKLDMMREFKMSDLDLLTYYLGIEVRQTAGMITMCQENFAQKILKECGMEECSLVLTPMEAKLKLSKNNNLESVDQTKYRSIVGSLRYLLHTRPDLAFSWELSVGSWSHLKLGT
jgi:Reverse transcriptase (RNA-dependent DNA polymerase)